MKYILKVYLTDFPSEFESEASKALERLEAEFPEKYSVQFIEVNKGFSLKPDEKISPINNFKRHFPLPLRNFLTTLHSQENVIMGLDFFFETRAA